MLPFSERFHALLRVGSPADLRTGNAALGAEILFIGVFSPAEAALPYGWDCVCGLGLNRTGTLVAAAGTVSVLIGILSPAFITFPHGASLSDFPLFLFAGTTVNKNAIQWFML